MYEIATSCTAPFVQKAGGAALTGPQEGVERMVAAFKERRDLLCEGLGRLPGFSCGVPEGAFYLFTNIAETGWPAKRLADRILEEGGVALLSGTAFGEFGEGYLRLSSANSIENIEAALERIGDLLHRIL